jgi:hypothetical protein
VRNTSAWGASGSEEDNDLASYLRSPHIVGAAVVLVAIFWVASALNTKNLVEVGPIPVLQEREVVYLDDEGIFVFWNDGAPYGLFEEPERGGRAIYCAETGLLAGTEGGSFDRLGREDGRGPGLIVAEVEMDGHDVFVNADEDDGERAGGYLSQGPLVCEAPGPEARGIVPPPD